MSEATLTRPSDACKPTLASHTSASVSGKSRSQACESSSQLSDTHPKDARSEPGCPLREVGVRVRAVQQLVVLITHFDVMRSSFDWSRPNCCRLRALHASHRTDPLRQACNDRQTKRS